jgi:hypothetical protein
MSLSAQSVSKMADAIKPEIINHIYDNPKFTEVMQEILGEALHAKLGDVDEDLFYELGMVLVDRIELV